MANPRLLRGRISQHGGVYSITTVVHGRRQVFTDVTTVWIIRDEMRVICEEGRVDHLAWVIMPDHLHWLFQLEQGSLGQCMQRFKSRTARAVNKAKGMHGPLWQSGYYEHHLGDIEDLARQARYLVDNPVRKGLVARIEDYPFWWSRWISTSSDMA
ncbi:MAG: transposase [Pseudoxanthomonas sp.]|nr:transposase [Pseudoxanthomonas sp.]